MKLRDRALRLIRKWGAPWFGSGGWWTIREPFAGAWQRNIEWTTDTVLAHHAVYACITLIASDIGKLRPKLVQQDEDGIWSETTSPAFSPVLRKPNHFQNHIQFKEFWMNSLLIRGNVYALKERDERRVVRALHLLDPARVKPTVAPDGSVFYELSEDNLSGTQATTVPASEIIHDRINPVFHPLCGTSPIFACGLAANIGLTIERNSAGFFSKGSTPGGILTAPGVITQPIADEMSDRWVANYGGENSGKVAVLGNGLAFQQLRMTAVDSQLIEQLKWTAETVCSAFHVPPEKIGLTQGGVQSNPEVRERRYYSDCLQSHIEHMEVALDDGLGIGEGQTKEGKTLGVELDLDGLLRMDTATLIDTLGKAVGGTVMTPNEARKKVDLPPLEGGDTVYMQQQNFSVAALAQRDRDDPFAKPTPAPAPSNAGDSEQQQEEQAAIDLLLVKAMCDEAVYAFR